MASGRMIKTAEFGERPEMKTVNKISIVAIELREAKKPLAVLIRPATAIESEAKPIIGESIVETALPVQEKNGKKADLIFPKKLLKLSVQRSSRAVLWNLRKLKTRNANAKTDTATMAISGFLGRLLTVKRRWGWVRTKIIINPAR